MELLAGRDEAALALIREMRELEDKPAAKLLTGLSVESRLEARKATGRKRRTMPH